MKRHTVRPGRGTDPRTDIIQPIVGAYWAATPEGRWLVPSGQALWIPPDTHHHVHSSDTVAARMLFVDPPSATTSPTGAGTVSVSPLLAALLERAIGQGNEAAPDGCAERLAAVLLDELSDMEVTQLVVPVSTDEQLAAAMRRIIDDPACDDDLAEFGRAAGAGKREPWRACSGRRPA